jgi:hypothetical protein
MNKLPITSTLAILHRMPKAAVHKIAMVFLMYKPKARGWYRALNSCILFRKNYYNNDLKHPRVTLGLWKEAYPLYPRLHELYDKNFTAYLYIIKPEIIIQRALDMFELDVSVSAFLIGDMREFRTPHMNHSMFDAFLHSMLIHSVDIPKLLDALIVLHDWPNCFKSENCSIDADGFWKLVNEYLEKVLEHWRRADNAVYLVFVISVRDFLGKYINHIDWTKHTRLYQCLNEEFLHTHPEVMPRLKWTSMLTNVQLGPNILAEIMETANNGQKFHGQNPNVAYIFSGQHVSEEFIEQWVVDKQYDQDQIWSNIFRYQTLSDDFKEKYKYKQPVRSTSALRSILSTMSGF